MGNCTAGPQEMNLRKPQRIGTQQVWLGQVFFSNSYATGGDTITAKSLGMWTIDGGISGDAGGYSTEILVGQGTTKQDALMKAYRNKDPGAVGGSDIPLPEVAAAVDLHLIGPQVIIWGH